MVVGLACTALALPACDDGTPVQRGFGSRQLVALRDPSFNFYASKGDLVYYYTGRIPETGEPANYWSIDLVTGEVHDLGTTRPDLSDPRPTPRFSCEYETDQQGLTGNFVITDMQTGTKTVLDRV